MIHKLREKGEKAIDCVRKLANECVKRSSKEGRHKESRYLFHTHTQTNNSRVHMYIAHRAVLEMVYTQKKPSKS